MCITQPLSAISFIGIVMLIGIVVNNGIVLIDYINKVRKDKKLDLQSAIVKACIKRLRPVLITTLTTVFGMFALIISSGEGSEIWRPLGISVIGGLIFSTIITLVFIPMLYYIFEKKKAIKKVG